MTIRAIRGATTLNEDERSHLHERTKELVESIMTANALEIDDVISVFFTCTPDIVSDFPAAAARELGFGSVPLMCAQEMAEFDPEASSRKGYFDNALELRKDALAKARGQQ